MRFRQIGIQAIVLVAMLVLWEWMVRLSPNTIVPKPTQCFTALFELAKEGILFPDLLASLAILNTEFLLVNSQIKATGDGDIFEQQELNNQSDKTLDAILKTLNLIFPKAAQMLEAAVKSRSFAGCPSPKDWLDFYNTIPGFNIKPPSLADLPEITGNDFRKILDKCKPHAPIWPAPQLSKTTIFYFQFPKIVKTTIPIITRSPNYWQNKI